MREKRTILKENSNHDNDNDKADIIRQMFRVLLREIEDFKL